MIAYVAAVLFADFLSGFFHWAEDSYGNPEMPLIGPLIIAPNIEHHRHPSAFLRNSVFSRNWLPVLLVAVACLPVWSIGLLTGPVILGAALLGFSNEIHAWGHMKDVPSCVRWLQTASILQTRQHHLTGHHRWPHDSCYCVITNVMNPFLDGIGFWRRIESFLLLAGIRKREQ